MNVTELAGMIQDDGYRAKIEVDEDGDTFILTKFSGWTGRIWINFDDEEHKEIRSISFRAGFAQGTTLEKVNNWNRTKRFVSVYMDDDGDPRLQMEAFVWGAGPKLISALLSIWDSAMGAVGELARPSH